MSDFSLLARRRFWPLFVSQFMGATNDNVLKNAVAILIIYRLGEGTGLSPQILVTMAAGLFISPYFLFSATAGQLSDRYEKSRLMRFWKGTEIAMAAYGGWALMAENVTGMLVALFLLGLQSTFTSPIKYAVLPEYLSPRELIAGNGLIEGGTFLAILLGTIAGGVLVVADHGPALVAALMMFLAVAGFFASLFLPRAHEGNRQVTVGRNVLRATVTLVGMMRGKRALFLSVMGISWFWLAGATYLTLFPAFAKDVLAADEHAVTLMLTMFSVGIGLGSVLCARLLKGEVSAKYVPLAALAMSVFALDLWQAARPIGAADALVPLSEFLRHPAAWRVMADLLLFAVAGGLFIVPLYAILQSESDDSARARMVAVNNVVNAVFMVAAAASSAVLLGIGLSVSDVFLIVGLANLGVGIYICGSLPDAAVTGLIPSPRGAWQRLGPALAHSGKRLAVVPPLALTFTRLVLGPVALALSWHGAPRIWFAVILAGGMLSDYFDGVLARALGVASPWLRRFDSLTDVIFYLFVLGATFVLERDALVGAAFGIALLLVSEAACVATSLVKFGRLPATHCYSAKLYGLMLFLAFLGVLCLGWGESAIWALSAVGLVANAEVLTILSRSSLPPVDVPTIFALLASKAAVGNGHEEKILVAEGLDGTLHAGQNAGPKQSAG